MSLPPNKNILKEFTNPVYVETGIWRGDSIQQAIEAGFKMIIGLDNDHENIEFCKSRFDLLNRVKYPDSRDIKLYELDSAIDLWAPIIIIDKPITFFLDAHWQLIEGTEKGEHPFPLMMELEQIARHPIKTHTIIIDDLLYMTHPKITGWRIEDITEAITEINPDYQFNLIANPIINNMLVAWI